MMGKDEKLSAYEVVLVTADKKDVEVRVSPDGKILEDTGEAKPAKRSECGRSTLPLTGSPNCGVSWDAVTPAAPAAELSRPAALKRG